MHTFIKPVIFYCLLSLFFTITVLQGQETPQALYNKAEQLAKNKKHSEALGLYQKAVTADPSFTPAYRGMVTCYSELGNAQGALKFMDSLFLDNPDVAEVYYGMGYALFKLCKYEEAGTYFEKAIQLKPDLAEAWNNRAAIFQFVTGDYKKARQYYEKAMAISSKQGNAWVLSIARENLAALPSAEDLKPLTLEEFLNLYLARAEANDEQGVRRLVLGQKKNCKQAMDWLLERAMQAGGEGNGDEEKTTLALAKLLAGEYATQHKSGELGKKLSAYTEIPGDRKKKIYRANSLLNAGMEKEQQGLYDDACRRYREACASFDALGDKTKAGLSSLYLGDAYRALKKHKEARTAYSDALTRFIEGRDDPQKALALSSLGIACFLLGEKDEALGFLKRSLSLYTSLQDEDACRKVQKNIAMIKANSSNNGKQ